MVDLDLETETELVTDVSDFGDVIVQNLTSTLTIRPNALPNALPIGLEPYARHDVMGDVSRYGADEGRLLAQRLTNLQISIGGANTQEVAVGFLYQLSFDAGLPEPEAEQLQFAAGTGTARFADYVDNDVLYLSRGMTEGSFADSAAGVGGGADAYQTQHRVNYLEEVGVLPEATPRDTLFESVYLAPIEDVTAPDNSPISVHTSYQLYWLAVDD